MGASESNLFSTNRSRAVRWSAAGAITNLGLLPGGFYSHALAINGAGTILGNADAPTARTTP